MPAMGPRSADLPPELLQQAMDWLVQLGDRDSSDDDRQRWHAWRQSTAQHELAWQQAETLQAALAQRFNAVPGTVSAAALQPPIDRSRRSAVLGLLALFAVGASAWWGLSGYLPDPAQPPEMLRTATGEQRAQTLADGTEITLNTATELSVRYSRGHRVLKLVAGEVLVHSGKDRQHGQPRPLVLEVPQGSVTPIGTRFTARVEDETTAVVDVLEGTVQIEARQSGDSERIGAGQTASLTAQHVTTARSSATGTAAWSEGRLIANDQPFCEFLTELNRYQTERLRCDTALSTRRISGAYELRNPARVLALAAEALRLRVERLPDGETRVAPR